MANGKVVELVEGARIAIDVTINETAEDENGNKRVFKSETESPGITKYIKSKADQPDKKYITRKLFYPFPAGFAQDPITGKAAETDMTPAQIGKAIGDWLATMKELEASGKYSIALKVKNPDGTVGFRPTIRDAILSVPTKNGKRPIIPTVVGESGVFGKGFKLGIQGPVNSQMVDQFMNVTAGLKTKKQRVSETQEGDVW